MNNLHQWIVSVAWYDVKQFRYLDPHIVMPENKTATTQPPPRGREQMIPEETNLFELMQILWNEKLIVLLFALVTAVLAGVFAFISKDQWTSVAEVSAPNVSQVEEFVLQRQVLNSTSKGTEFLKAKTVANNLFMEFVGQASSQLSQRRFLEFSQRAGSSNPSVVDQTANSFVVKPSKQATPPGWQTETSPYYSISLTATTPQAAQRALSGYIEFVNDTVLAEVSKDFIAELNAGIYTRNIELSNIEANVKHKRSNRIAELQSALNIAQQAGLRDYGESKTVNDNTVIYLNNSDSSHLFMMGAKFLKAELATTMEAQLTYPPRYEQLKREVGLLKSYSDDKKVGQMYAYRLSPTMPLKKDAPKRGLIILSGLILGAALGSCWVLLIATLRKRKAETM